MTQPLPPTDQQLADYIGPKWESRYRRKFERFRSDPRGRFRPSWNWYAALFPTWFFAHRLYAVFFVLFACAIAAAGLGFSGPDGGGVAIFPFAFTYVVFFPAALAWLAYNVAYSPGIGSIALLMVGVALMVAQGAIANWLLYRKALTAAATTPPPAVTTVPNGRPRRPPSLVSPVAAVVYTVVVGFFFLGSFVPQMCGCPSGYGATMVSNLMELRTYEETYFEDHGSYTSSTTALNFEPGRHGSQWSPSAGVSISITSANATGWAATASHKDTYKTCGIFVGSATATIAGQEQGEPKCVAAADSLARPPSHR